MQQQHKTGNPTKKLNTNMIVHILNIFCFKYLVFIATKSKIFVITAYIHKYILCIVVSIRVPETSTSHSVKHKYVHTI